MRMSCYRWGRRGWAFRAGDRVLFLGWRKGRPYLVWSRYSDVASGQVKRYASDTEV